MWLETLKRVQGNKDLLEQLGIPIETIIDGTIIEDSLKPAEPRQERSLSPICERCHNLIHEHHAPPLPAYPTLDTLSKLLLSSPHKFNHIYHLIDAADFPLSLSPRLRNHLYTTLPKSITRHLSVSYIITRCDLLMPEGEKVEGLPLSNTRLHAISSRVGWEVGILKDEIKQRQGGVWLLGVVNVGKSSLLRDVWPINGVMKSSSFEEATEFDILPDQHPIVQSQVGGNCNDAGEGQRLNPILDRARGRPSLGIPHVPPTISEIPGTTAAPLRVSYKSVGRGGKTRGELVDLPGMERWTSFGETGLTKYVRPEKWRELIMKKRIDGDQYTIKPGQSMLLGGLVMITPLDKDTVVLANPFTALPVHVSSTEKCKELLSHPNPAGFMGDGKMLFQDPTAVSKSQTLSAFTHESSLPPAYASAGIYTLAEDVTASRNRMLQTRSPVAISQLPYKVLATDIILEGLGWVELVAQVRNRQDTGYKTVDINVVAPEGKGVDQRRTMNAYVMREEGARAKGLLKKTVRPRRSMKGHKKMRTLR